MSTTSTTQSHTALQSRHDGLKARSTTLGKNIHALVPMSGRSPDCQRDFLFALADWRMLESFFATSEDGLNTVIMYSLTPAEIADKGKDWEELNAIANSFIAQLTDEFGVSEEAVKAASIGDFTRSLDFIESVLHRAEAAVATISAQ